MRVAVGAARDGDDWQSAADFAVEAERLGVHSLWSGEAWGYDAVTPLAFLAGRTSSIRLGTGILQVGARSPAMVAMASMSLASISGGRFILGMGVSGPQVMEGWHGVRFDRPVQRTRELIEIVRLIFRGERLSYEGQIHRLPLPDGEGRAIRPRTPPVEIPVYVAALGPRNLRMTGELAQGWIGDSFMPETAEVFLSHIREGAEGVGRTLEDIDVQAPASLEFSDDVGEVAKRHARGFAFAIGAMGSAKQNFNTNAFARQGFAEAVYEVQRLWLEGKRDEARELVPIEIGFRANLLGTPDTVKERLRVYRDAGINTMRVGLPGDTTGEKLDALAQLMDLVTEVNAEADAEAS